MSPTRILELFGWSSVTAHEILKDLNEVIYSQGVRTAAVTFCVYKKSLPWTLVNSNDYQKEDDFFLKRY